MTNIRVFKKEYAKELLSISKSDLDTARALKAAHLERKENTLFHVQQSIEKALKSVLCWFEIPVPMIHDLGELSRTIPPPHSAPHSESLYDLTQFATIRRYEDGVAILTDEEVESAIEAAQDVIQWANSLIQ